MKKNKITVFNGCVDSHLEDLDYFENLIQKHYQKFTYGYNILSDIDIFEKISKIDCIFEDKMIKFIAKFKKKITKKDSALIDESVDSAYNCKKFNADVDVNDSILTIHISKDPNYIDTTD